jgi:hypothetical protein
MEAPLHKSCGTKHWLNQPCPLDKVVKELAALTAMPDAEIDTSDIPEVKDWSGAKRGGVPKKSAVEKKARTREPGPIVVVPGTISATAAECPRCKARMARQVEANRRYRAAKKEAGK